MKFIYLSVLSLILSIFFISCQKEVSFDNNGTSSGTLKKDANGDCAAVTVNGVYKMDSVLNAANFVDVQVNVSTPGTFEIHSDTINGFSFRKVGSVPFGTSSVRLYASGKPLAPGNNIFTVKYGSSTCMFTINVAGAGTGVATFSIGGSPGSCTGAVAGGVYTVGAPLVPGNTLTVQVNVSVIGTYAIGAATNNGFIFSGSGTFLSTGLQNVILNGAGTPVTAGPTSISVTNIASTCLYSINVLPVGGGGPAVYTLDGSPGSCTGFVINGTYTAAIATTATNTITVKVNVTALGSYTITSNTANGISFSKTGTFATLGAQTVILTATGTPTAAGTFNYTATGAASSTCVFSVLCNAPASPAVYTLSGAPTACTPVTVSGNYFAGTPLGATNTATVQVNVTTTGSYTLTTNTVNGITFSKTGLFTVTGLQNVVLVGSGTPTVAIPTILTPSIGTSSCTFPVTVASANIFQCKINGVLNTFTDMADGVYYPPNDLFISGGKLYASFPDEFSLDIDKGSTGAVTTGTYVNTLAGSIAGGYIIDAGYRDALNAVWNPASVISTTPDPFTIIITSLTATRVTGTFSGTVRDNFGTGTNTKTITEGIFNLPIN
jgi:hypothetical protein